MHTSLMTFAAMVFAATRSSNPELIMIESVSPYITCQEHMPFVDQEIHH